MDDQRYYNYEEEEDRRQVEGQDSTLLGGRSDGGSDEDRAVDYSDVEELEIGEGGRTRRVNGGRGHYTQACAEKFREKIRSHS